jgi:hypothetical protein
MTVEKNKHVSFICWIELGDKKNLYKYFRLLNFLKTLVLKLVEWLRW